jgi:hypothetical protein
LHAHPSACSRCAIRLCSLAARPVLLSTRCCLQEHLLCKVEVINQLSAAQQAQRGGAGFEVRVVGFDPDATSLLSALLRADPAQRPTAEQVHAGG